jgi:TRAP-type mannitol/chloroaromatic compound transport system permease small subunit
MIDRFLSVVDHISEWVGNFSNFLIFGMLGVLLFEVLARYLFSAPTIWAHELSGFIFGTYFILLGANVLRIKGHVGIDILYGRFPVRVRAIIDLCTFIFFLLVCITLIWWGGQVALQAWQSGERTTSDWLFPLAPIRTIIAIGAILLLLQGIAKFIRDLRIAITGETNHA